MLIPRTQIRGLIEAERVANALNQREGRIPRTQIRGLIEAVFATRINVARFTRFRGLRSAASLKQILRGPYKAKSFDSADSDPRPH